jgi:hypothetical protein
MEIPELKAITKIKNYSTTVTNRTTKTRTNKSILILMATTTVVPMITTRAITTETAMMGQVVTNMGMSFTITTTLGAMKMT